MNEPLQAGQENPKNKLLKTHWRKIVAFNCLVIAIIGIMFVVSAGHKRDEEHARDAGAEAAEKMLGYYGDGIAKTYSSLYKQDLLQVDSARKILETQNINAQAFADEVLTASGNKETAQTFMDQYHNQLFGDMSEDDFATAFQNAATTVNELAQKLLKQNEFRTQIIEIYDERIADLQQRFGLSSEQIFNLAQESSTNLMDATWYNYEIAYSLGLDSSKFDASVVELELDWTSLPSDEMETLHTIIDDLAIFFSIVGIQ